MSASRIGKSVLHAVIRRPLYKTLVHGLRDVDPQAAAMLESSPRLRNPTKRNTMDRMVGTTMKASFPSCWPKACKAVYTRNAVPFDGAKQVTAPAMSHPCGVQST